MTVIGFGGRSLTVTDRITADPPAFGVALAHVWPSRVGDSRQPSQALDVAERAVAALGIDRGPTYTQLRIGPDGPEVMEVAARLGGGHDAELVETALGIPLNDLAIDAALGRTTLVTESHEPLVGGAVTRFLVAPPGVLESVEVPPALDGVLRVRLYRDRGFVFTPLRRGGDRAGAVLAVGASREHALARADAAAERIRFVTADAGSLVDRAPEA